LQVARVVRTVAGDNACVKRIVLTLAAASAVATVVAGAGSAARLAEPPSSKRPPSIAGATIRGATLTASTGSWSGSRPMSFQFQWLRCKPSGHHCDELRGETAQTHRIGADDVGHRLRVRVTAANSAGSSSQVSDATGVVAEAKPPDNVERPTIGGEFREGGMLRASIGSWTGTEPISFTFQWQRCRPDGSACNDVRGATRSTYTLTPADVDFRPRIVVTAKNAYGSEAAHSSVGDVSVVGARGTAPANTAEPTLTGVRQVGRTLAIAAGTWKGSTPMRFAYSWLRCNSSGGSCVAIGGASGRTYKVASRDVGFTLRGAVTATNPYGKTTALTRSTGVVGTPLPKGAIKLPNGLVSLPVSSVSLPQRLVIDQVSFSPFVLRSRVPFTAQFRVRDTRGYVVRDALVYAVGVPFDRLEPSPEVATGVDGVATVTLTPTAQLPLRRGGSLVLFVRGRKPGDDLLGGVSTRRLVSVRTAAS
jgi:hypothetical protein